MITENSPELLRYYDQTKKAVRHLPCIVYVTEQGNCGGCHLKLLHTESRFTIGPIACCTCESCGRIVILSDADSPLENNEEKNTEESAVDRLGYRKIRYHKPRH